MEVQVRALEIGGGLGCRCKVQLDELSLEET